METYVIRIEIQADRRTTAETALRDAVEITRHTNRCPVLSATVQRQEEQT